MFKGLSYLIQIGHSGPIRRQRHRVLEVFLEVRTTLLAIGGQSQQEVGCGSDVELFACVEGNLVEKIHRNLEIHRNLVLLHSWRQHVRWINEL